MLTRHTTPQRQEALPDTPVMVNGARQPGRYLLTGSADVMLLPGAAVETFVLAELLKHIAFSAQRLSLWHYRTQNHIEVDFILENRLGEITGIVLYAGRDVVPFGENLWAVPLGVWWLGREQA